MDSTTTCLATRSITLPSGLKGSLVMRGIESDSGSLFFHFHPNTKITIGICTVCSWSACLKGMSAKEVANWLVSHFKANKAARMRGSGTVHEGDRPDVTTLSATLKETFMGYESLGDKACSVALSSADVCQLNEMCGIDFNLSDKRTIDKLCYGCFLNNDGEMCCLAKRGPRQVLTRPRAAPIAVFEDEDKDRIKSFVYAQNHGRALASLMESANVLGVASSTVSKPGRGIFEGNTVEELTRTENFLLAGGLKGAQGIPHPAGSGGIMGIVMMPQGLARLVSAPAPNALTAGNLAWSREDTKRAREDHESTPFLSPPHPLYRFVENMGLNVIPRDKLVSAAKTVYIDMNDARDRLIVKSVREIIDTASAVIQSNFPDYFYSIDLHDISRAAQIASRNGTPDGKARFAKDFVATRGDALNEIIMAVTKCVKMLLSTNNVLSIKLLTVFHALEDNATWSALPDTDKIAEVADAIGYMLEGLVFSSDAALIRELVGYLCLDLRNDAEDGSSKVRAEPELERDRDEDDDDDGLNTKEIDDPHVMPMSISHGTGQSKDPPALPVKQHLSVVHTITLRKFLFGMNRMGKIVVAHRHIRQKKEVFKKIGKLAAAVADVSLLTGTNLSKLEMLKISNETIATEFEDLNKELTAHNIFAQLTETTFFSQMAHLLGAVMDIEGDTPSSMNGVRVEWTGPLGIVVTVGGTVFDASNLLGMGKFIRITTLAALASCLMSDQNGSGKSERAIEHIEYAADTWIIPDPGPRLNTQNENVGLLLRLAKNKAQSDPSSFRKNVETFRNMVLACIDVFGSSTIRTQDFAQLVLSGATVVSVLLPDGVRPENGLIFLTTITKTDRQGYTVLHPFLSRLLLVLMDGLVPLLFDDFGSQFSALFDAQLQESAGTEDYTVLNNARDVALKLIRNHLRDKVTTRVELNSRFVKELQRFVDTTDAQTEDATLRFDESKVCLIRGDANVLDLSAGKIVHEIAIAELNNLLNDLVCAKGLLKYLTAPRRRKLFVFLRCYIPYLIEALNKQDLGHVDKRSLDAYRERVSQVSAVTQGIQAGATSGQHSLKTAIGSYLPGHMVSTTKGNTRLPQIGFDVATLVCQGLHLFFSLPSECATQTLHRSGPPDGMRRSVIERHIEELRNCGSESETYLQRLLQGTDEHEAILLEKLKELTRDDTTTWASSGQKRTALLGLVSKKDLVVCLDTGEGKTLGVLAALACDAKGGIILFVSHLQNLHDDMILTWKDKYNLDVQLFQDIKMNLKNSTFDMCWPLDGPTRYVMITVDQLGSPELSGFVLQASFRHRLRALIVDEVHATTTTLNYRSVAMRHLMIISRLVSGVRRVLISGTLPEFLRTEVLDRFGVHEGQYDIVFSDTLDARIPKRAITVMDTMPMAPPHAALALVKMRTERPCRVIVFCPTKKMVSDFAREAEQRIVPANGVELIVMKRVSGDSKKICSEFLAESKNGVNQNKCTVFVGTTVLVEGWDPLAIDTVIVIGGIFGGLIALLQAVSRAGRGRRNYDSPLPQCFVLQSTAWLENNVFRSRSMMIERENLLRKVVRKGYSREADMTLTMRSVDRLLRVEVCPAKELASLCKDKITGDILEECGECATCDKDFKVKLDNVLSLYLAQREEKIEFHSYHEDDEELQAAEELKNLSIKDHEEEEKLREEGLAFFRRSDHQCILCPGSQPHYPNKCPNLHKFFSVPKSCWNCGQRGHNAKSMQDTLTHKVQSTNTVPRALTECAHVGKRHPDYHYLRPCTTCWLVHDVGELLCSLPKGGKVEPTASNVRACFLYVWSDKLRWSKFCVENDLDTDDRFEFDGGHEGAFNRFVTWGVYHKGARVQNAFRVLLYVRDSIGT